MCSFEIAARLVAQSNLGPREIARVSGVSEFQLYLWAVHTPAFRQKVCEVANGKDSHNEDTDNAPRGDQLDYREPSRACVRSPFPGSSATC
jgi:hypothetical protein